MVSETWGTESHVGRGPKEPNSQPKLAARFSTRANRSHVRDFKTQLGFCQSSSISGTPSGSHIFAARWFLTPQSLSSRFFIPFEIHIYLYLYSLYIHHLYLVIHIYALESSPQSLSLANCFPLKQPDRVREYIYREREGKTLIPLFLVRSVWGQSDSRVRYASTVHLDLGP